MRICFVGLGSIAKRHIRNIKEIRPDAEIDVLRHSENNSLPEDIRVNINEVYTDISQLGKYDSVFITNPTSLHYKTLKEMVACSNCFFIEKPVFETGNEDVINLGLKDKNTYYVACPLRYTNVISYLKNNIDFNKVYSMRVISSSYLPEWRPGIDYRETYSAKKELGGGVSIDLIHEWDYIYYLLGAPNKVNSIISTKSHLQINSDDIAVYIAEYDGLIVEVHLDYFGRVPIRKIELYCETDTLEADLINQRIIYKKDGKIIELSEDRDSYQKKELEHFFSIMNGDTLNDNTIEEACRTLRITRGEL